MSSLSIVKIIAYDTKINYRLVQLFQFFSQKLSSTFLFIDAYYNNMFESINSNVGHNKTHYELFQQTQLLIDELKTVTTEYINEDPSIYDEAEYLLIVSNAVEVCLSSLSQYIHNFGYLWLESKLFQYGDDYSIEETGLLIDSCSKEKGIINIMNQKQLSIMLNILNTVVKVIEQSNSYFSSLFQQLDNNNDNITQVTQVLFPELESELEQMVYFSYFASTDFNIITLNRENILESNINDEFTEKIVSFSNEILKMKETLLNIFSLI
jgi:hypothetical protein